MNEENQIKLTECLRNDKLEKYRLELAEDTKISISNLREKSMMVSSLWAKWINYYHVEKENLARVKKAREKYLKKKMPSSSTSILALKNQDNLAENDETMKKINDLSDSTKEIIEYIQQALDVMSNFGFQIKNTIEICKIERM